MQYFIGWGLLAIGFLLGFAMRTIIYVWHSAALKKAINALKDEWRDNDIEHPDFWCPACGAPKKYHPNNECLISYSTERGIHYD